MIKFIVGFIWKNKGQIVRFATVGATSAIIDFGVLYLLTSHLGVYYLLSATISFVLAATYNFSLNRNWTFRSNGSRRRQLPIFFSLAIMGILINNGIMYLGVDHFGIHYLLAKVFSTAIVTVWNFFGNKYITFKKIERSIEESDNLQQ